MLAGRVGGSLTAELGTMNVTEQLDALRVMGADPVRVLVVPHLRRSFGWLKVLDDVSLQIKSGDSVVVIGASGTGKSVLLKHIVGLLKPDEGEVWFDKQRIDTMPERKLMEIRKRIGFLFQMGAL